MEKLALIISIIHMALKGASGRIVNMGCLIALVAARIMANSLLKAQNAT